MLVNHPTNDKPSFENRLGYGNDSRIEIAQSKQRLVSSISFPEF
jgi:hypothetical protein